MNKALLLGFFASLSALAQNAGQAGSCAVSSVHVGRGMGHEVHVSVSAKCTGPDGKQFRAEFDDDFIYRLRGVTTAVSVRGDPDGYPRAFNGDTTNQEALYREVDARRSRVRIIEIEAPGAPSIARLAPLDAYLDGCEAWVSRTGQSGVPEYYELLPVASRESSCASATLGLPPAVCGGLARCRFKVKFLAPDPTGHLVEKQEIRTQTLAISCAASGDGACPSADECAKSQSRTEFRPAHGIVSGEFYGDFKPKLTKYEAPISEEMGHARLLPKRGSKQGVCVRVLKPETDDYFSVACTTDQNGECNQWPSACSSERCYKGRTFEAGRGPKEQSYPVPTSDLAPGATNTRGALQ